MGLSRQCAEELAWLATKDFLRALKAAQRLQRAEVRLLCTLAIAQRVLAAANEKNAQKQPHARHGAAAERRELQPTRLWQRPAGRVAGAL
jgi:hypothetical protein